MRVVGALAVACVGLGVVASPSRATFPGGNGLLVYEAQQGKHVQLFTIRPQGGVAHQLTHFTDSDAVWPSWSPDGSQIAFERDFRGHAAIYTMNADGSGLRALTRTGLHGRPSWSPDGKTIVFSTLVPGHEALVSLIGADGAGLRTLASMPLPAKGGCPCLGLNSPTFSPDGRRIAFTWTKAAYVSAIFTISSSGRGLTRITPWKDSVADKIDWDPGGNRIAFSSPEFGKPGVSSTVFTVAADGSAIHQLTHTTGGKVNNGFDSWSPDGTKIAFASNRGGTYAIYTMNTDGTDVTRLTRGPEAHHAAWGRHR